MPMVVDFPAPFGPSNPKMPPAGISIETPSSATTSNFFFSFLASLPSFLALVKPMPKPMPRAAMGGGVS